VNLRRNDRTTGTVQIDRIHQRGNILGDEMIAYADQTSNCRGSSARLPAAEAPTNYGILRLLRLSSMS
jgi:hypothetical protein